MMPKKSTQRRALLFLLALVVLPAPVSRAGASDEPVHEALSKALKKDWLRVGFLVQVVGDAHGGDVIPGESGFSIANARVSLGGDLDGGFGWFVQGNFTKTPTLLDGRLSWMPGGNQDGPLRIEAGQFKSPFSAEFLISAANIDFVNRSQAVSRLAPGREIGAQVSGRFGRDRFDYRAGVFNGNGVGSNANDNDQFLAAARLGFTPDSLSDTKGDGRLSVGVNVAASDDEGIGVGGGLVPAFRGSRELAGVDGRFTRGKLMLSAEGIWSSLDPEAGRTANPWGYHATAGWMFAGKQQVLARWDSFSADDLERDLDLFILGYNLWPTSMTEVQVNWVIPDRGGFDSHQLLVNFQVSF